MLTALKRIKIFHRFCLLVGYLFVPLCLNTCSTGGGALPQASIPAPSADCQGGSDCITVSSPDSTGLVTISANAGAVPDSSVVIIEVGGSTSSLVSILSLLGRWISQAYAQTLCVSELDECSEDTFDESCQLTAEADGSFFTRIPAGLEDRVRISYLDADSNCDAVETLDKIIESGFLPLKLEGEKIAVGLSSDVYIFGSSETGASLVQKIDLSVPDDPIFSTPLSVDISGSFQSVDFVQKDVGSRFVIVTNQSSVLLDETNNQFNTQAITERPPFDANLSANKGVLQRDFQYSQGECPDLNQQLLGQVADRAIFSRDIDPSDALDREHPVAILDGVNLINDLPQARAIRYDFESFASEVSSLSGAQLLKVDNLFRTFNGNKIVFLGLFKLSTGSSRYFLFEVPGGDALCDGVVSLQKFPGLGIIEMPDTLQAPGDVAFWDWSLFNDVGAFDVALIPDPVAREIFVAEFDADRVFPDSTFDLLEDSHLAGVKQLSRFDLAANLPIEFIGIGSTPRLILLEVDANAGADGLENILITELPTDLRVGVRPVDMRLILNDIDLNLFQVDPTVLILSQGVANNGLSFLRVIQSADLP